MPAGPRAGLPVTEAEPDVHLSAATVHFVVRLAFLTFSLFPLYPTSCRYFHTNFVPMKELSHNALKPHSMSQINFPPVHPEWH